MKLGSTEENKGWKLISKDFFLRKNTQLQYINDLYEISDERWAKVKEPSIQT